MTRLTLTGAAWFDLRSLAPLKNLAELSLFDCRELVGAETLMKLPALKDVEIVGARSIPGYERLRTLTADRIRIDNNYVFDEKFLDRVDRDKRWRIARYKGAPIDSALGGAADITGSLNDLEFAPFVLAERIDGRFELVFDDWIAMADTLNEPLDVVGGVARLESIARTVILGHAPTALVDGTAEFDSEGDAMYLILRDLPAVKEIGQILKSVWNDKPRFNAFAQAHEGDDLDT
jgi:hypothetical protein